MKQPTNRNKFTAIAGAFLENEIYFVIYSQQWLTASQDQDAGHLTRTTTKVICDLILYYSGHEIKNNAQLKAYAFDFNRVIKSMEYDHSENRQKSDDALELLITQNTAVIGETDGR